MEEKFDWTIVYEIGKPGIKEEPFYGTFNEAFRYAANHANGWGFQIQFEVLIPDEKEGPKEETKD